MPVISVLSGGRGAVGPNLSPPDPFFSSVVLLTHIDSEPAVDVGPSGHTLTTDAGTIQTTVKKFGTHSYDSENLTNGHISALDSDDWHFAAGEFTFELWAQWEAAPASIADALIAARKVLQGSWSLKLDVAAGKLSFEWYTSGVGLQGPILSDAFSPTLDQWYHIAVDRDSSDDVRIYIDGAVRGGPTSVTDSFFNSTAPLTIGNTSDNQASWAFDGFIDEVRITKGVARYGGAFTPPTLPFPDS